MQTLEYKWIWSELTYFGGRQYQGWGKVVRSQIGLLLEWNHFATWLPTCPLCLGPCKRPDRPTGHDIQLLNIRIRLLFNPWVQIVSIGVRPVEYYTFAFFFTDLLLSLVSFILRGCGPIGTTFLNLIQRPLRAYWRRGWSATSRGVQTFLNGRNTCICKIYEYPILIYSNKLYTYLNCNTRPAGIVLKLQAS